MEKPTLTYSLNGGFIYAGDLKFLLRAIIHLFVTREKSFALESHHGTDFKLVDYKLSLSILANGWSHDNKGNGQLKLQFVLRDDVWYKSLDKYGITQSKEGRLSDETKEGFKHLLNSFGLGVEKTWDGNNTISVVLSQPIEFVANIIKTESDLFNQNGRDDAPNPAFEKTLDENIADFNLLFDSYNALNKH